MQGDIYISYSAINDFLRCPGLYAWKYQYRNPHTDCKVDVTNPGLILGIVFETVRKRLSNVPPQARTLQFALSEYSRYFDEWRSAFGFESSQEELGIKNRGTNIINRFFGQPQFIQKRNLGGFIKVPFRNNPHIYLCGSTDWVEENPDGTLSIVDFKTGTHEEQNGSLQLPIYRYLVEKRFNKSVTKVYYWYLDKDDAPRETFLNSYDKDIDQLFTYADSLLEYLEYDQLVCKENPKFCSSCEKFVNISLGKAKLVYTQYSDSYTPKPSREYYKVGVITSS